MENIVIGTAGHIDHGKTTLIQELTGINTDVLPEEKKRGITINIGFSYLENTSGKRIGIIDVPGHEKFIKNMVAGAVGIQYLLMVIACDDGIMQQTKEHFNICQLLGIRHGMIVLTKTDLCSKERVLEVEKEVKEYFKGTFLENAIICKTSKSDKSTYEHLRENILEDLKNIRFNLKNSREFQLAVDRVFSVKGFGVVVTGTSLNSEISVGDTLTLYPKRKKVRVKKIENHGSSVEILQPGNRCALNLVGVDLDEVQRGNLLSKNEELKATNRIDCFLTLLKECKKLKNNSQIRLDIGTKEIIGKVKIFDKNELKGGETAFVQLELKEDIIVSEDDLGILRSLTPISTIGGIRIINVEAQETKRNNQEYINQLKIKSGGEIEEKIYLYIKKEDSLVSKEEIDREFGERELKSIENKLVRLYDGDTLYYITRENYEERCKNIKSYFENFYEKNPLKEGLPKAEIRNKFFLKDKTKEFNIYLEFFKETGFLEVVGEKILLSGYKVTLTKNQKIIKDEILKSFKEMGFNLEKYNNIFEKNNFNKEYKEVFEYLVDKGLVIYLGEDTYIMSGFFKEAKSQIQNYLQLNKKIKLGEFRDLLKTNRRVALLLLDKFDAMKLTEKKEEYRVLRGVQG